MNGNDSTPSDGENAAEPIIDHLAGDVEDLDAADRQLLVERLDTLATRVSTDLHALAAVVMSGESPAEEDVETGLADLRRADETVRRCLTDADGPDLSTEEREEPTSRDVWGGDLDDAEELVDASHEEVALRLSEDVHQLRSVADRVDRKLHAEDLTEHEAGELWQAGARIASWGRDVLVRRPDRRVLSTPEGEEEEEPVAAGGEDA